jgi:hypothetical protein
MIETALTLLLGGLLTWEDMSITQAESVINDPKATEEQKNKAKEQLERLMRAHEAREEMEEEDFEREVTGGF